MGLQQYHSLYNIPMYWVQMDPSRMDPHLFFPWVGWIPPPFDPAWVGWIPQVQTDPSVSCLMTAIFDIGN